MGIGFRQRSVRIDLAKLPPTAAGKFTAKVDRFGAAASGHDEVPLFDSVERSQGRQTVMLGQSSMRPCHHQFVAHLEPPSRTCRFEFRLLDQVGSRGADVEDDNRLGCSHCSQQQQVGNQQGTRSGKSVSADST
ncbi:MAG: hypothetical protein IPK97_07885 [Ahniella sp.]|nr:hypothetical protein [Ahniella sp.]